MKNFISAFLLTLNLFVSAERLDSLKNKIPALKGRELADAYLEIGDLYLKSYNKSDSFFVYSSLAKEIAEKINYSKGTINSNISIGIGYSCNGDFKKSEEVWISSLILAEKYKDKTATANIHYEYGYDRFLQDDYTGAMEHYTTAATLFEEVGDHDGLALTYCRMAYIFDQQKQEDQTLLYTNKALKLIPGIKKPYAKVSIYSAASGVFVQRGTLYPDYCDTAIVYAQKAFQLSKENNYFTKGSQLCNSLASAFTLKKDYNEALKYCHEMLTYRKYMYPNEIIITYLSFSDCYQGLGNFKMSLSYLDSVSKVLETFNDVYYSMSLAERVYTYNKEAGNTAIALQGLEKMKALQDSLYTINKNTVINELEQKYNRVQNEKTITELNQQKEIDGLKIRLLVFGSSLLVLIILLIIFIYRQSLANQKRKVLEAELRLNRTRMNPHFFFNALSSIQTLSLSKEKGDEINSYISKFARIMRTALESSYTELIPVSDEVEFLTGYLDIQKFYLDNKFDYSITASNNIEATEFYIPAMILQPFIENSIEHGFRNINYTGKITIEFKKEGNEIYINITDNGKGIKENEENKSYPSRATQIIKDRLFLLNKKYKSNASYTIESEENDQGTKIKIRLPIITQN